MKLVVFIHIAILPRWKERIQQYLSLMDQSGLINVANQIVLSFVGEGEVNSRIWAIYGEKIIVHRASLDLNKYELPTQKYLYDFCYNNLDYKVLYIHTKGVGKEINPCIEDWINYMTYFCITQWRDCVNQLETYQTAGLDLRDSPTLHYSGNFWWAKSSYIAILPDPYKYENIEIYPNPINSPRHNQEFWICFYKDMNFHKCIWESKINCYERHLHRYPPESYIIEKK